MKRENEENLEPEKEPTECVQPEPIIKNKEQQNEIFENVNKKDDIMIINPPAKRHRPNDEEIRLLIPSKMAGAVIGKGGQNIQKLRTDFNVQVNIGDCKGPERVITIASTYDNCCRVILEIMKHYDRGTNENYELRLLIHQSLAGCIIGKNGTKIKALQNKIGCRLKVFSNVAPNSSDRIVHIAGKEGQCMECLTEILDMLKVTPIKGPIYNYDPQNFNELYADEYGGYGKAMNVNSRKETGRFSNNRGRNRFSNGERFMSDRRVTIASNRNMRDYIDPWAHNMPTNNQAMNGMDYFGMKKANNNVNFGNNFDLNPLTSSQVSIPKDLAGAVIGKAGNRIKRIRKESNASIMIDEAAPGSINRIITITGTQKQIQTAQYLLQQCVRNEMK